MDRISIIYLTSDSRSLRGNVGLEMRKEIGSEIPDASSRPLLVGTWIEIVRGMRGDAAEPLQSFPSWERGLKSEEREVRIDGKMSVPSWERGLKFDGNYDNRQSAAGRSLRGNVD